MAGDGGEGGGGAAQDAGGADVGVLVEGLADEEAEGPERDVVWDVWGEEVSIGVVMGGVDVPGSPALPKKMASKPLCFKMSIPPSGMYRPFFL